MGKFRILRLLLYKSYLVRKRHWFKGLLVEILIPLFLLFMIQSMRELSPTQAVKIDNFTFSQPKNLERIVHANNVNSLVFFYAPNTNNFTNTLMEKVVELCHWRTNYTHAILKGFPTENDLIVGIKLMNKTNNFAMSTTAILFDDFPSNFNSPNKSLSYRIRRLQDFGNFLYTSEDVVGAVVPDFEYKMFTGFSPLAALQICLDQSFIDIMSGSTDEQPLEIFLQKAPIPPHVRVDPRYVYMRIAVSAFAVFAFMFPLLCEVSYSADEKFIGVNVLMSMHGVPNVLNLISWLISSVIYNTVLITLTVIILNFTYFTKGVPFVHLSSNVWFWILLFFISIQLFTYGIHISMYFSKARFMIPAIMGIYVVSSNLQYYLIKRNSQWIIPFLGIIFPDILIFRVFQEINNYESLLSGIGWDTMFEPGDLAYGPQGSTGFILIFSILGAIIHFIAANYVYAIHPGKYGVAKHPLFFLGCFRKNYSSENDASGLEGINKDLFEPVPLGSLSSGIQIEDLKKSYFLGLFSKKEVKALKGVTVDFYKGRITALLGKNGAGKTTMMSILTGMMSPNSGSVKINGRNMKTESKEVLLDLGLCPQENMLFPSLSVLEQVRFFGMLKGHLKSKSIIDSDVNKVLKQLNLFEKRNALSSTLSGGQKRRTCLALALVGNSSILILDEPTSGMDPKSKRDAWDLILGLRGQKTILISTHDMEEANILGDRIAIMDLGQLKSYGTPMFLKKSFGQGNMEVSLSTEPWSDVDRICDFLGSRGKIQQIEGAKITLTIPNSPDLPNTLDDIDRKKIELGISGMSVSLITLEQVFLSVTNDSSPSKSSKNDATGASPLTMLTKPSFWQGACALMEKKLTYMRIHWLTVLLILLLPPLAIFLLLLSTQLGESQSFAVPYSLSIYPKPQTYAYSNNETLVDRYKNLTEQSLGVFNNVPENITQALVDFATANQGVYTKNLIAAAEITNTTATAFFNEKTVYSIPISINLLSNVLLQRKFGNDSSIQATLGPKLIETSDVLIPESSLNIIRTYVSAVVFLVFVTPAVALLVIHPLKETISNVKQLQMMSGASWLNYWGTMFVMDLCTLMVSFVLAIICGIIMDHLIDYRLLEMNDILVFCLASFVFSCSVIPFVYLFTFTRMSTSTVSKILNLLPFSLFVLEIIMLLLSFTNYTIMKITRDIQHYSFKIIPHVEFFGLMESLINITLQNANCRKMEDSVLNSSCLMSPNDDCCHMGCVNGTCSNPKTYFSDSFIKNIFTEDSIEERLSILFLTIFLYFGLLGLLECKIISILRKNIANALYGSEKFDDHMDEQVRREKQRIETEIFEIHRAKREGPGIRENAYVSNDAFEEFNHEPDIINARQFLAHALHRRYGRLVAVEQISFGVKKGECFGLLGVNGAGKSTSFRMMTGAEVANKGEIYVTYKSLSKSPRKCLAQMGYCPQTDALISSLNAYDHLRLFARIRGVPEASVDGEVIRLIKKLNLSRCALQASGTYSGGNKRRLSIAIAMIGNPSLILLDEPTTGVDPAARRLMWNIIRSCQAAGQSIIFTSHSMEECEALCDRLAIMVRGKLVCIGASEQLKQSFGIGYDIEIKLNIENSTNYIQLIKEELKRSLVGQVVDENSSHIVYHVIEAGVTWNRMYNILIHLSRVYDCIVDYSVQSSTLEQLFLKFARGTEKSKND